VCGSTITKTLAVYNYMKALPEGVAYMRKRPIESWWFSPKIYALCRVRERKTSFSLALGKVGG
jgi:hypothetical protein